MVGARIACRMVLHVRCTVQWVLYVPRCKRTAAPRQSAALTSTDRLATCKGWICSLAHRGAVKSSLLAGVPAGVLAQQNANAACMLCPS